MKLSNVSGVINETKLVEYVDKYNTAKKLADKYLYDTQFVINIVDLLVSKGVLINVDKSNQEIWNDELECYTPMYAMYIWREVVLPTIGIDYDTYKAISEIKKMKLR
jgi:hypothetical protein